MDGIIFLLYNSYILFIYLYINLVFNNNNNNILYYNSNVVELYN